MGPEAEKEAAGLGDRGGGQGQSVEGLFLGSNFEGKGATYVAGHLPDVRLQTEHSFGSGQAWQPAGPPHFPASPAGGVDNKMPEGPGTFQGPLTMARLLTPSRESCNLGWKHKSHVAATRTEAPAQAREAGRPKAPGPAVAARSCPALSCPPGRRINHIFTLLWCDFLLPASNAALYGAAICERPQHEDTLLPDEPGSGHPKITEASGAEGPSAQQLLDWGAPQGRPHMVVGISTPGNKSGALRGRPSPSPRKGAEARRVEVLGPHGLCRWGAKLQAPGMGLPLGEHSKTADWFCSNRLFLPHL